MILALLAIGAQYRYETKAANALYQAGRSIMLDRLHGGNLHPPTNVAQCRHASMPDIAHRDYMGRKRALLLLDTLLVAEPSTYTGVSIISGSYCAVNPRNGPLTGAGT